MCRVSPGGQKPLKQAYKPLRWISAGCVGHTEPGEQCWDMPGTHLPLSFLGRWGEICEPHPAILLW